MMESRESKYSTIMAKKMESEKAKIIDELKEQHVSPVKTRRGKGFMCYADQVANVPNKLKKDVVPRKTRSLTIVEEAVVGELANSISIQEPRSQRRQRSQLTIGSQTDKAVADMYNEWGQKLKGPTVEDPAVQSLLDLRKRSKASKLKSLRKKKQPVAGEGSSAAHNKYYSPSDSVSDVTLYSFSSDNSKESTNENDDAYESNMDLFDDNPHRDNDDARKCSQKRMLIIYYLYQASVKKIPYSTTTPQPRSLQAKAKNPMQKAKNNMTKINFKKAVAPKFREYD
ncbi:hypothetical protein Tco_0083534 [Tanacetum coccineum]